MVEAELWDFNFSFDEKPSFVGILILKHCVK